MIGALLLAQMKQYTCSHHQHNMLCDTIPASNQLRACPSAAEFLYMKSKLKYSLIMSCSINFLQVKGKSNQFQSVAQYCVSV